MFSHRNLFYSDSQLLFIPSTEVLVKCLFFIAPYAVVHSPRSYSRIILCSHHPCLSSSSSTAGVYKVWILLAIFYQNIFMPDWFHQILEVAKKVETRTDFLCWLNYSQKFVICKVILIFLQGKSPNSPFMFDLCPDAPNNLVQLAQFTHIKICFLFLHV